jgi:tetratricopeptide (TPR) repeat protein
LPFAFPRHYLGIMGQKWAIACPWAHALGFVIGVALSMPVSAQPIADDAAAREYFNAGRAAFDQADYESALTYFWHAYRTSGRAALLYNIAVAADRLQRDEEALEAFEQYLDRAEKPPREAEVRTRIEALKESIAEKQKTERALMEAKLRYEEVAGEEPVARARRGAARDLDPAPSRASVGTTESRPGAVAFQMPKYSDSVDRPSTKKKKKWPWIVAAAAVAVVGGVTAGVIVSQRSKQTEPASGGFAVNW